MGVSPVGWTDGDDLAEEQRGSSRPPVPFLGGQRDDRAAADVALQQVDQLFVRAAVEDLDQQNTRTLTHGDIRHDQLPSWSSFLNGIDVRNRTVSMLI